MGTMQGLQERRHRWRPWCDLTVAAGMLGLLALTSLPAEALPSYARQTGDDCSSCHLGSFGPQLTPHGIAFKLGGYAESNGKGGSLPLSGMLVASFTKTSKDQADGAGPHAGDNDNAALQEVSAFLAGGLTEHLGSFAQVTYSGIEQKMALDNVDIRYAQTVELGGRDAILGLTFNNSPTLTDPFNSLASWRFPYTASELAPTPMASPLIDGGLAQQVGGITAYGLWDNSVYAEIGGYHTLGRQFLENVNVIAKDDPLDRIDGLAPYWRLAYFQDLHKQAWHVGLFGFAPDLHLDGESGGKDRYLDWGLDASYQFLGTREHMFAVNGSYTHEQRHLDGTAEAGGADQSNGHLNRFDLSGSYHYQQTWGLSAGLFNIQGNSDQALYGDESRTGSPNSAGYILQADWSPLGKEGSWGAPAANLRLGLQYTGYTKFNGAKSDYDGAGHDAGDNNTLFAFLWSAF